VIGGEGKHGQRPAVDRRAVERGRLGGDARVGEAVRQEIDHDRHQLQRNTERQGRIEIVGGAVRVARSVPANRVSDRRDVPVVHVGRLQADVAKRRDFEPSPVRIQARDVLPSRVLRRGRMPMLRNDWFVNIGAGWQMVQAEVRKKLQPWA